MLEKRGQARRSRLIGTLSFEAILQRRVRDPIPRMISSSAERPSLAAAQAAAALCLDLKANDVVILDLDGVTDMTDYFVIASGTSDTHVRAIAEHVAEEMKKAGVRRHHVEGLTQGRWVLLDFVDFVVHVFHPTLRSFYQLERLWGDASGRRGSTARSSAHEACVA